MAVHWLLACAPAFGHVVSMSSAELTVEGRKAAYELRMPLYEIQHVTNPQTALFEHVGFEGAKRTSGECREDSGTYVCTAAYEFAEAIPNKLGARCTLFQVTVPNHVHLLHATQGTNGDQVVFDQRFTDVEVRFHPPSAAEKIAKDAAAGFVRLWRSVSGVVFLFVLALAAEGWRERLAYFGLFLAGEWLAIPLAPRIPLAMSSGFLESAMALTGAYLAVDLLLLPQARSRWPMFPVFGLTHGLYFAAFPVHYLSGACVLQAMLAGIFGLAASRLQGLARRTALSLAVIISLGWFAKLLVTGG